MKWTTRRRNIALIGGLAVLLAACASEAGSTPQEITVNTSEEATSGISVSGMGEVTGAPDTVEVGLGVSVLGETVDQAATTAAEKAQAVIDALTSNGVAEEDITTTDYSIYPEYDYSSNEERLIGYRVTNTVKAKIRDLDSTGTVLDAATVAGGDDVVVNGLSFSIEDNDELVAAAREAAWNDALTKANQLAELSGQSLGEATTITETVSMPPIPIPYAAEAAGDRALETPIEPGTSAVTITLQVQFALAG
ncbi:MAG TPA: SIMPL domain-containing protein [Acidimicrobiia bacterium]|nr:SIMPL domain-containing protein [Acidimicrobiia bacterium]